MIDRTLLRLYRSILKYELDLKIGLSVFRQVYDRLVHSLSGRMKYSPVIIVIYEEAGTHTKIEKLKFLERRMRKINK